MMVKQIHDNDVRRFFMNRKSVGKSGKLYVTWLTYDDVIRSQHVEEPEIVLLETEMMLSEHHPIEKRIKCLQLQLLSILRTLKLRLLEEVK